LSIEANGKKPARDVESKITAKKQKKAFFEKKSHLFAKNLIVMRNIVDIFQNNKNANRVHSRQFSFLQREKIHEFTSHSNKRPAR
jgi:hypothetical protein